ncbi:MAG TPA: hypothetical protein VK877_02555 [Pseudolabrys sp.]|nr:hypothetical protein [Pseudolabrys sp.]
MAKRKQIESAGGDPVANSDNAPQQGQTELPLVDSPSLSPATSDVASEPVAEPPATLEAAPAVSKTDIDKKEKRSDITQAVPAPARWQQLRLRPRHRRYAVLAASVAIAAAAGVLAGATMTGGFSKPASVDVVGLEESKAAQQSIARLSKDVASLKASFEAANKSAHSQFAKISERLARDSAEITGAIKPPQTVPPTSAATAPLPPARPGPAAEVPRRPSVITDWTIRETRDGFVYVQGHGDVYQVVPGAPLPGIGPVEQIKRQDGRWVVVTPKGIIVSMRDRRYFEQF